MKTFYIIPWFRHDANTLGYRELSSVLQGKWYKVVFVKITWNFHVMSDYIKQAESQIQDTEKSEILGFSFGAMIALKLSEKNKFGRVFLCSLSPYFSEDLHLFPKYYKLRLWLRRWRDFRDNYHEVDIQNKHKNIYIAIYGSEESERLQNRVVKMIELLNISEVAIVKWVWHDIAHRKYLEAVIWLI